MSAKAAAAGGKGGKSGRGKISGKKAMSKSSKQDFSSLSVVSQDSWRRASTPVVWVPVLQCT